MTLSAWERDWSTTTGTGDMADSFNQVFSALRAILQQHTGKLLVSEDSPTCYCLEGGLHPKHKKPMPIAWVRVGKNYVSFHHLGVYARPALLKGVSKKLKARMQGKSCFNFTSVDEPLFAELEELTVRAFDAFRKLGYMK
jgi:hypothetical protein